MTVTTSSPPILDEVATQNLVDWAIAIERSEETFFHKAQILATQLGAIYRPDGLTQIGFWAPELAPGTIQPKDIYLEVLTPTDDIDLTAPFQTLNFRRERVQLQQNGEYFWGVVRGLRPGTRSQLGSLYWLKYWHETHDSQDLRGEVRMITDVLAHSLPYGVFAPAEVYDMAKVQAERADLAYFQQGELASDGVIQVAPPVNILQMHVNTASAEGTLAGLTRVYQAIARKLETKQPLTPAEQNYIGYGAVQLLPIEPTIEYRGELGVFWHENDDDPDLDTVSVTLRKPNTQNWGYDVVIAGSSATNPAVLGSLRPDELVDFIATLHTFPTGPIHLIYDLVYGHADNQAQELLNGRFLKGPNMYGQDINHQNPTVRAILLEMQRRKINAGADGIRVDGAQDFKFFNPLSGYVEYDDAYLIEMGSLLQEIGGQERRLFSIFEDGRPWPQEGWEKTSTYREVITFQPDSYQWGPLIFAHNTPALQKFWDNKWDRICEVMHHGSHWITGCGNHDTVRRGTQVDPNGPINWNLGQTLPEVLDNAYDNPATTLFTYGFCPGLPMDFINATMHAPWGFIRNTDDYYGVKVMAEEAGFLDWQIEPALYTEDHTFPRLKQMGFLDFEELKEFVRALQEAIIATDYDLDEVASICQRCLGDEVDPATWEQIVAEGEEPLACPPTAFALSKLNRAGKAPVLGQLDVQSLQAFAKAFMEDCHDICHVALYTEAVDPARAAYNLGVRQFRAAHPWLRGDLGGSDRFNRVSGEDHTIFYGLRQQPEGEGSEQIVFVAHMGGEPATVTLADWLQLDLGQWEVVLHSPGLDLGDNLSDLRAFTLKDSEALLLMPKGA